jgi:hypothetical protein
MPGDLALEETITNIRPRHFGVSKEKIKISGDRLLQWRSDQAILRVDKNLYSSVQPFLGALVR